MNEKRGDDVFYADYYKTWRNGNKILVIKPRAIKLIAKLLAEELDKEITESTLLLLRSRTLKKLISLLNELVKCKSSLLPVVGEVLEELKDLKNQTGRLCEKLQPLREKILKKIETWPYITPGYLSDIFGFNVGLLTPKTYAILLAINSLESQSKKPNITNISSTAKIRRDKNLEKLLEELVRARLLKTSKDLESSGVGRKSKNLFHLSPRVKEALIPGRNKMSYEAWILLNCALSHLREKGYLALATPVGKVRSIPDAVAVPPTSDGWDWRSSIAVEIETEREIRYHKRHILNLIYRRIRQGYVKIIFVCKSSCRDELANTIKNGLKTFFPDVYKELLKSLRNKLSIIAIDLPPQADYAHYVRQ